MFGPDDFIFEEEAELINNHASNFNPFKRALQF